MKLYIVIIILLFNYRGLFSQNWVPVVKTVPNYSFSLPGNPTKMDTLNIRYTYYQTDSLVTFHVIEFIDTPLDSSNVAFQNELRGNGGDTLQAIAQSTAKNNNATITNSSAVTSFQNYKGLEVIVKFNDLYTGKVILACTRYFYNPHSLISFTVTGSQDASQKLLSNKNTFFNSIILQSPY